MLSLTIARRYLLAKKSHTAVNVITIISVLGVAIATMAMVVVMSVFNGFAKLSEKHLSYLDPDLQVTLTTDATIANGDSLAQAIERINGVSAAMPTLSQRALMVAGNAQTPVEIKGVPYGYDRTSAIDSVIIDGEYRTENTLGVPAAQISVGVANALLTSPSASNAVHLYVPRRIGRINPANPAAAFRSSDMVVSSVFRIGQTDVDASLVIVPIEVARDLLEYDTEASAIDIKVADGADVDDVKAEISRQVGDKYTVKTRLEQRSEAFRMIKVEKWLTLMILIFILVITLFNIASTISLLAIEKRDNMATLQALGASFSMVRKIFAIIGFIITAVGACIGAILGVVLALAQQYGKLIKLNADASVLTIDAYPCSVALSDIIIILAMALATAVIVGYFSRFLMRKS